MKPDPNFPRMMFHRTKDPVIVNSQAELDALGRDWGYRPGATDVPAEEEPEPEEHEEPAPKPQPPPVRPPARVPVHAQEKPRSKKRAHR